MANAIRYKYICGSSASLNLSFDVPSSSLTHSSGGGGGGGKLYLFEVDVTHNYVHTSPLPSYYWSYYTGACGTSVLAQLDNISLVAMLRRHGVRMRYGQNISQVQRQDKSMISDLYVHTRANFISWSKGQMSELVRSVRIIIFLV